MVAYLGVKDGGVGESVVGEDVCPIVDLLQSQVDHRNGSSSNKASCLSGDVGEIENNFLPICTLSTQPQCSNCEQLQTAYHSYY